MSWVTVDRAKANNTAHKNILREQKNFFNIRISKWYCKDFADFMTFAR